MAKLAKLDFTEHVVSPDDPAMKAEILLLSSSMRVPSLEHKGLKVWDTLAIGEYLNEIKPKVVKSKVSQGILVGGEGGYMVRLARC